MGNRTGCQTVSDLADEGPGRLDPGRSRHVHQHTPDHPPHRPASVIEAVPTSPGSPLFGPLRGLVLLRTIWRMDPAASLQAVETSLRLIIREVLDEDWTAVGGIKMEVLESKRVEDRKRRDGAIVNEDLLSYVEFHHLRAIVSSKWDAGFSQVFGDKKRTDVWLGTLEDMRNAIGHSRTLLPFEADLFSGISGQLRNQVTIFRTGKSPASKHYPLIESVMDQYGQVGQPDPSAFVLATMPGTDSVDAVRLEVGDVVTFVCQASDPRGREIEWNLWAPGKGNFPSFQDPDAVVGDRITVAWTVTEHDVGEDQLAKLAMRARGARFYRGTDIDHQDIDDIRFLRYGVNPPTD